MAMPDLGVEPPGLQGFAASVTDLVRDLGAEDPALKQYVYLVTVSRVLPTAIAETGLADISAVTREQMAALVRDAFDRPVAGTHGGRPVAREDGIVRKLVVFKATATARVVTG